MARVSDADVNVAAQQPVAAMPGKLAKAFGRRLAPLGSICVLMIAWEVTAHSGVFTPYLLPSLETIFARVAHDVVTGHFFIKAAYTLYRALAGFALAALVAVSIGTLMSRKTLVRWFFDPIISVGFPMPKVAFLPIFLLWFGAYDASKILLVAFAAFFAIAVNTVAGTQGVERYFVWSAQSLGLQRAPHSVERHSAGRAAANPDRLADRSAAGADRLHRRRDADGRRRSRRIDDLCAAFRRLARRVRRHRRDRVRRLARDLFAAQAAPAPARLARGNDAQIKLRSRVPKPISLQAAQADHTSRAAAICNISRAKYRRQIDDPWRSSAHRLECRAAQDPTARQNLDKGRPTSTSLRLRSSPKRAGHDCQHPERSVAMDRLQRISSCPCSRHNSRAAPEF